MSAFGRDHPDFASSLVSLAFLFQALGKLDDAEPLLKQAMEVDARVYGRDHPEVATDLNNLAGLYESQGKYDEANRLGKEALRIAERALGPDHPTTKQLCKDWGN